MYGVPRETVLQVIARCGLDLIEVQDDHSCGDDWVSHRSSRDTLGATSVRP